MSPRIRRGKRSRQLFSGAVGGLPDVVVQSLSGLVTTLYVESNDTLLFGRVMGRGSWFDKLTMRESEEATIIANFVYHKDCRIRLLSS
ncbi:hypothetical protein SAMN05443582_1011024 [Phyllobacterium sp. OV277]|nr:hypothetical protein SAMN05443582_1011024 [Phyllobacterium sp. OV277]